MDYEYYDVNANNSEEEARRSKRIRPRTDHFEYWDDYDFFYKISYP